MGRFSHVVNGFADGRHFNHMLLPGREQDVRLDQVIKGKQPWGGKLYQRFEEPRTARCRVFPTVYPGIERGNRHSERPRGLFDPVSWNFATIFDLTRSHNVYFLKSV